MSEEIIIEERRTRFKADLRKLAAGSVVDRHVIFGDCYILDKDGYFNLKEQVADHFGIHPPQVVMVGSGKLGFSLARGKRYRSFGETSDLDIAIVAPNLFDRIWEAVFSTRGRLGYWPGEADFSYYLARGWIRPDKLPPARKFEIANDWWDFFNSLTASGSFGPFKIGGGLYRDWTFLKGYQNLAVMECKIDLETAAAETGVDPAGPDVFAQSVEPLGALENSAMLTGETRVSPEDDQEVITVGPAEVEKIATALDTPEATQETGASALAAEINTHENDSDEPKT